jgi:hypothetical protein
MTKKKMKSIKIRIFLLKKIKKKIYKNGIERVTIFNMFKINFQTRIVQTDFFKSNLLMNLIKALRNYILLIVFLILIQCSIII